MKISVPTFLCLCLLLQGACQQKNKTESSEKNQSGNMKTVQNNYQETHRPQLHFSPPSQWMNDPNGMVYYEGEYHLFYQHYPDSTVWGPMHWGHAVSQDLIHWENLPIALYPDSLGYIFSGSAVIDWENTTGFGTKENPAMVAIYTYHDPVGEKNETTDFQTQGIAYSLDKGRTWGKYKENPVLPNPGIRDFRDPKVFWHEDTKNWVMILAAQDQVKLYGSKNLKDWVFLSDFGKTYGSHGGVWECPDLFPLSVEGGEQEKWVMIVSIGSGAPNGGSGTQYFVGDFDGKTFSPDPTYAEKDQAHWLDYGTDNYAGVTWSDLPSEDGRRIFMGWMSNWQYATVVPTREWRSAMTLARTLLLKEIGGELVLCSKPVKEFSFVRQEAVEIEPQTIVNELNLSALLPEPSALLEIDLVLEMEEPDQASFMLKFSNARQEELTLGFTGKEATYYIDRTDAGKADFHETFAAIHEAPRFSKSKEISLKVILDVSSIELFADGGEVVMTDIFFPSEDFTQINFSAKGTVQIKSGKITPLQSIWTVPL